MSGGGGGVIIIHSLIQSGVLTTEEKILLHTIADRSKIRCSWLDARRVQKIVRKYLRP